MFGVVVVNYTGEDYKGGKKTQPTKTVTKVKENVRSLPLWTA